MYNPTAHLFLRQKLAEILSQFPGKKTADFESRLFALFNEIYSRFTQLYSQREDFDQQVSALIHTLAQNYIKRPQALKKLDSQREAQPDWFRSEQIAGMMLYVDRFNKDLKGLIEKVDYFEELGVNLLHLMPVLDSPKEKNDGG